MATDGLDFGLMVFEHTEGAEQAYSRAPRSVDGVAWADQVAFVEHHRRNRIIVRGTFAGRYVDADDELEFIGGKTAEGVVAGGAVASCSARRASPSGWSEADSSAASRRSEARRTCGARSSTRCAARCQRDPRP